MAKKKRKSPKKKATHRKRKTPKVSAAALRKYRAQKAALKRAMYAAAR